MISRRTLIRNTFLVSLGLLPVCALKSWGASESYVSATVNTPVSGKKNLVVILLRGGMDGLSVVSPYRDPLYKASRPSLSAPFPLPGADIQDLDGYFGLHGRLNQLMPHWKNKTLAFIHAAGSPDPNRSHFDAQDYLESGTPGNKGTTSGWLNRLLGYLETSSPVPAINIGVTTPRILSGSYPSVNITLDSFLNEPSATLRSSLDALYQGQGELSLLYQQGQKLKEFLDFDLAPLIQQSNRGNSVNFKDFSYQSQIIAKLIRGQASSQIACVVHEGSWDTHGGQSYTLYQELHKFGQGLSTLVQDLGEAYRDTVIVVLSEFGRSLRENSGGGTDHGRGNAVIVMGGSIRGGKVHGQWRGLEEHNLEESRDLPVTTDFRDILGTIFREHLQLNDEAIAAIFPDHNLTSLPGLII